VLADLQAPEPVKQILRTSCYDCHSNETKLPWFDEIVPAYWLVVSDVKSGRQHMNFSDFNSMPPAEQKAYLFESISHIQLGAMPPRKYTLIHPNAVVTPEQLKVLKDYVYPPEAAPAPADAAEVAAADEEYQKWISDGASPKTVAPEFNGLAFFPDYKNWKPVSTTDRFDNKTLRVILGNEVAVRAIAENNVHPWPDGAAFAKIAWAQRVDDQGVVRPGKFVQVEFMIKDAKKYASTEGWGFGRWRGTDLAPYGKSSDFAEECTSCHAPMHDNDFVYTMPIKDETEASDLFNNEAVLPKDLPYQPLQESVITSFVDKPKASMSTLYGNDVAVSHARTSPQGPYPRGAVLSLVTWHQQEDMHWFGARIPAKVESIEFVTVGDATGSGPAYSYQAYGGTPLTKQAAGDAAVTQPRIDLIVGLRASVMP
jgi:Haem-binding domain/Cytochrome P460